MDTDRSTSATQSSTANEAADLTEVGKPVAAVMEALDPSGERRTEAADGSKGKPEPPVRDEKRGCEECDDLGIRERTPRGTRYCSCRRGKKAQRKQMETLNRHFEGAGIPRHLRGTSPDTLRQVAPSMEGKRKATEAAEQIAAGETVDGRRGLLLYGPNGMGKTGLMVALCRAAYVAGWVPLFLKYTDFIQSVQDGYGRQASGTSGQALGLGLDELRLRVARTASLLVLDDIGDPFARDDRYEETEDRRKILFQVVSHRHEAGLPTHFNANFRGRDEMIQQIGPRIADRMREMSAEIEMTGVNLRDAS